MKTRGLLLVVLLAVVAVYFLYFAKSGGDKGLLRTEVDQYLKMKVQLTQANLETLGREILSYAAGDQGLPEDLKDFQRSRPGLGLALIDAWGRRVKYEKLSDSSFRLRSAGPDGVFGTADDIVKDF
jgi:hypothetical protein